MKIYRQRRFIFFPKYFLKKFVIKVKKMSNVSLICDFEYFFSCFIFITTIVKVEVYNSFFLFHTHISDYTSFMFMWSKSHAVNNTFWGTIPLQLAFHLLEKCPSLPKITFSFLSWCTKWAQCLLYVMSVWNTNTTLAKFPPHKVNPTNGKDFSHFHFHGLKSLSYCCLIGVII